MPIILIPAISSEDCNAIAALAKEIWQQHFTPIIGGAQVEYMLGKFQSAQAVKEQIGSGVQYFFIQDESSDIGYTALIPDTGTKKLMISKIYIRAALRGKGAGRETLELIEAKCLTEGFASIWLTVNRFNDASVEWYKKRGFTIIDEVKKDIGGGFFMDDFIMEKKIAAPSQALI